MRKKSDSPEVRERYRDNGAKGFGYARSEESTRD